MAKGNSLEFLCVDRRKGCEHILNHLSLSLEDSRNINNNI